MSISIDLEKIKEPLHKNYYAKGLLELKKGHITHLIGENGVGKSSLIHTFKVYKETFFNLKNCQFILQKRLESVNQINVRDFFSQMLCFQNEELRFFKYHQEILNELASIPINQLSGGQNQIVKILLSAYLGGDIFFLDEPLLSLDKKYQNLFYKFLNELVDLNKYIFIIEHSHFDFQTLPVKKYYMNIKEGNIWIS